MADCVQLSGSGSGSFKFLNGMHLCGNSSPLDGTHHNKIGNEIGDHRNLIFNKKSLSNSDSIAQKFLEVLEITSNFDLQNNPHKLSIRKYKLRWAKRLNLLNWIQATGQATICGPQYGQFIGWNLNIKRFSLKITDRSVWKDSIESF